MEDAEYCIRILSNIKLFNRHMKINRASKDRGGEEEFNAKLFIGNLDMEVDEKLLFDHFSQFGAVLSAKIMTEAESDKSRGFGFLTYESFESSDRAIELMNGQYLANRPVSVGYAFKKDGSKGERHGSAAERELAAKSSLHRIRAPQQNMAPIATPHFLGGRVAPLTAGSAVPLPPPPPPSGPPPMQGMNQMAMHHHPSRGPPPGPGSVPYGAPQYGGMTPMHSPPPPPPPHFGAPPPPPQHMAMQYGGGPPPFRPPPFQGQGGPPGQFYPPPPQQQQQGGFPQQGYAPQGYPGGPPPPPPQFYGGAPPPPPGHFQPPPPPPHFAQQFPPPPFMGGPGPPPGHFPPQQHQQYPPGQHV